MHNSQVVEVVFADLFKIRPQIHSYLYKWVGQSSLAEDLTQETFLKLYCALQKGDLNDFEENKKRYYKWAYTIARNVYIDDRRKRKGETNLTSLDATETTAQPAYEEKHDELIFRKDLEKKIENCMANLPQETRHIFRAIMIDGKSREAVSAKLAISLSTLKRRLRAARELLSRDLHDFVYAS